MLRNKGILYIGSRLFLIMVLFVPLAFAFASLIRDFYAVCDVPAYSISLVCILSSIYTLYLCCYIKLLLVKPIRNLVITKQLLQRMPNSGQIDILTESLSNRELSKYNSYMCWLATESSTGLNSGVKCILKPGVFRFYI